MSPRTAAGQNATTALKKWSIGVPRWAPQDPGIPGFRESGISWDLGFPGEQETGFPGGQNPGYQDGQNPGQNPGQNLDLRSRIHRSRSRVNRSKGRQWSQ